MTPPSDEAFIFDILSMKDAGMNLIRKHCKLEPLRWYYHCDRLGILVWQDIVNGGETVSTLEVTYLPTVIPPVQTNRGWNARACGRLNPEGRREHIAEIKATLRHLYNVPSLAGWVIFNEGWGQFSTVKLTRMVRELDPSRPIDAASGWYDFGTGDYKSVHNYFRTLEVPEDEFYSEFPRAAVISEYGGLAHPVPGHVRTDKIYGYQTITDPSELKARFAALQAEIRQLGDEGLSGAIYTQVCDIEEEINGLLTYDRRVNKLKD
jgi:beta-galactosidase/beta-glucuronidase